MAVSFHAATGGANRNANGTTDTITLPTVSDGDVVIVQFWLENTNQNPPTVTQPAGYTLFDGPIGPFSGDTNDSYGLQWLYWHAWHTGDPTSLTFTWTQAAAAGTNIYDTWQTSSWTGANTASPIAATADGTAEAARSTSVVLPSVSPAGAGFAVVAFLEAGGSSITWPAGWTDQRGQAAIGDTTPDLDFATQNVPASPSGSVTVTFGLVTFANGTQVAIAAAAATVNIPPSLYSHKRSTAPHRFLVRKRMAHTRFGTTAYPVWGTPFSPQPSHKYLPHRFGHWRPRRQLRPAALAGNFLLFTPVARLLHSKRRLIKATARAHKLAAIRRIFAPQALIVATFFIRPRIARIAKKLLHGRRIHGLNVAVIQVVSAGASTDAIVIWRDRGGY